LQTTNSSGQIQLLDKKAHVHKKGRESRPSYSILIATRLQRFNLRVHAALMTSCLISADNANSGGTIENRNNFLISSLGGGFVGRCDRRNRDLEISTHHRALAGVTLTALFGLACAFFC
jgi:hypothetical protein